MLQSELKKPVSTDATQLLFSEEQQKWLAKAIDFAKAIPKADIIAADRDNIFRRDLFEKACQLGFGALPFGKEFGGAGGDYVSFCLVNEVFARYLTPIMSSLGVHVLCQEPIYRFGTEEQKQKYLVPSSSGKFLAAFCLTEPQAGSDTAALQTKGKLVGDEYILNGTKTFITSGGAADYYIVMAKLQDPQFSDEVKSITSFIVEKNFPGLEVGQKFDLMGMRGYTTCEIVLNDCRVPKENLLGEHGDGRKVALSSLAKGRITIAAQCCGWAQSALDKIREYSASDTTGTLEGYGQNLGKLVAQVASARALTFQAAYAVDRGEPDVVLASMAKTQASDAAVFAASEAISIIGWGADKPDLLLERLFRDTKVGQIYEGTNQILRLLIARNILNC
jgi:acyl-CoA dehydrogenase